MDVKVALATIPNACDHFDILYVAGKSLGIQYGHTTCETVDTNPPPRYNAANLGPPIWDKTFLPKK